MRSLNQIRLWGSLLVAAGIMGSMMVAKRLEGHGWAAMAGPAVLVLSLLVVTRLARPVAGGGEVAWVTRLMAVMVIVVSSVIFALSPEDLALSMSTVGTAAWIGLVSTGAKTPAGRCLPRWSILKRGRP